MGKLTAVAISGGIDSLMAAYILKKQGNSVIGIHFITGYETDSDSCDKKKQAKNKISFIADQLGINYKIFDCRRQFKSNVVNYFIKSYTKGLTPNPCIVCNSTIKFGAVLEYANKLGAARLATGHYAKITKCKNNRLHLAKGVDSAKNQAYFLAWLTQKQLSCACFPLGDFKKQTIIQMAKEKGFFSFTEKESQDVCFVQKKTYGKFLLSQPGFRSEPGLIEDISGNIIGEHKGLHLFTVGQRRRINCPASEPYYVVRLDHKRNRLVAGFKNSLFSSRMKVSDINWINMPKNPDQKIYTQIRGRHEPQPSRLINKTKDSAVVIFDKPQAAITPGQGAVFYINNEVCGGGWIE